jgi:hypothetical protein
MMLFEQIIRYVNALAARMLTVIFNSIFRMISRKMKNVLTDSSDDETSSALIFNFSKY